MKLNEMYDVFLSDNGTLDTQIIVKNVISEKNFICVFDSEYAAQFRRKDGSMTKKGLIALGNEALCNRDEAID